MTDRETVTAVHRPPVRQSTLVRSGVDHTFDVFVRTIGVWWPRQPYSMGGDRVRDVTVEPHLDGRVLCARSPTVGAENDDPAAVAFDGEVLRRHHVDVICRIDASPHIRDHRDTPVVFTAYPVRHACTHCSLEIVCEQVE